MHLQYIPRVEDTVVGIVTERLGEAYRVDIRSTCVDHGGGAVVVLPADAHSCVCLPTHGRSRAMLPLLAFQGATKRNRPNLTVGALVYARVVGADRDMEPELSCQGATGRVVLHVMNHTLTTTKLPTPSPPPTPLCLLPHPQWRTGQAPQRTG